MSVISPFHKKSLRCRAPENTSSLVTCHIITPSRTNGLGSHRTIPETALSMLRRANAEAGVDSLRGTASGRAPAQCPRPLGSPIPHSRTAPFSNSHSPSQGPSMTKATTLNPFSPELLTLARRIQTVLNLGLFAGTLSSYFLWDGCTLIWCSTMPHIQK